jgi:hypothetical protein
MQIILTNYARLICKALTLCKIGLSRNKWNKKNAGVKDNITVPQIKKYSSAQDEQDRLILLRR